MAITLGGHVKTLLLFLTLSGCYLELGAGVGRTTGPHIAGETGWVVTVSAGADFSRPSYRALTGGSVEWSGGGHVQPVANGFTLGADVKVAGGETSQTRVSARVTPLSLSWVEGPDGSQRGYAVPTYLGISRAFDCNERMQCAHVGIGVDSLIFHRTEYGYGAFIAPQFRISATTGFLQHLRSSTGNVP
jgi:hypothetical protein